MKFTFTPMMVRYLVKLAVRVGLFVGVFSLYWMDKPLMIRLMTDPISHGVSFIHILWLIFMVMMLLHIVSPKRFTMALLKIKDETYVPVEHYSELELWRFVRTQNSKAWTVMLIWLLFNAIWGLLFLLGVVDTGDLLMLTVFYFLSDYICILFFCPFQTLIMKNRCCVNCRIYDWGHFMMFTPMLFLRNFFSWSLFFMSCIVLIRWEISYATHPERFWSGSNQTLQCAHCKDKTCQIKRRVTRRPF